MKLKKISLLATMLLLHFPGITQSTHVDGITNPIDPGLRIEDRISQQEDIDPQQLADQWYSSNSSNINLNSDEVDQLADSRILTEYQVNKIKEYRAIYGDILSLFELLYIEGLSEEDVKRIQNKTPLQFKKATKLSVGSLIQRPHHFLLLRYQRSFQNHFEDQSIPNESVAKKNYGNPDRLIFKYEMRLSQRIRFGITGEKDPGERFGVSKTLTADSMLIKPGFDFYSYYLAIENIGILNSFIIGKYRISFGQGLNLAVGSRMLFTDDYSRISTGTMRITPHFSTDEQSYFQGVCFRLSISKFFLTGFVSSRKLDCSIMEIDSGKYSISSFVNTGYHRNVTEWAKHQTATEKVAGLISSFRNKFMEISIIGFTQHFDKSVHLGDNLYEMNYFNGHSQFICGSEMRFFIRNHFMFTELSFTREGKIAFLAGIESRISPVFSLGIYYREFPHSYYNFFGHAFGAKSLNNNERGIYAGLTWKPDSKTVVGLALDYFIYPWLNYRCDQPSSGKDFLMRVERNIAKGLIIRAGFKVSGKSLNDANPLSYTRYVSDINSQGIKLGLIMELSDQFSLNSRIDWNVINQADVNKSKGVMVSQDIAYALKRAPVRFYLRWSNFETEDYESRIYSYERDVSYAFSVPAYQSKGHRYLIMTQFTLLQKITIWFRYGLTSFDSDKAEWPGMSESKGKLQSEVKAQMVVRL